MKPILMPVLAGAAAVALAGVAGWAAAGISDAHVLDLRLPDGARAHIRYVGNTPPSVSFTLAAPAVPLLAPAFVPFGPDPAFAALERLSEAMDRQAGALLREASARPGPAFVGPGLAPVDIAPLPPGGRGFSMVSTLSGNGVCTRSVEYRSFGDGKPPRVVTHVSGACQADPEPRARAETPRSSPAAGQRT